MTVFSKHISTTSLLETAAKFSSAQRDMAAKSKEDFEHWHHVAVADVIDELVSRLRASQGEKEIG